MASTSFLTAATAATTATTAALPNASLSWSQNRRSKQRINPSATLDLHGYGKEEAIRAVTKFWDDQARSCGDNPWVNVITGVGAHSGALGGPILKQAIHKLLIKRDMEYSYSKKPKGIFLVNVRSGHVLKQNPTTQELIRAAGGDVSDINVVQETPWQDTKLKVVQREHIPGATAPKLPSQKKKATGKKARKDRINDRIYGQSGAASYAMTTTTGAAMIAQDHNSAPRPSELAADQRMLDQAKSMSLKDSRKYQSQRDREENAVKEAIQKTQQEALEEERLQEEEFLRALALSEQQPQQEQPSQHDVEQEEKELARILELSLQEQPSQPDVEQEEKELARILELSRQEQQQQQTQSKEAFDEDKEEEAELQRVLRMSMVESQQQQHLVPDLEESFEQGIDEEQHYSDQQPWMEEGPTEETAVQNESSEPTRDDELRQNCPQNTMQEKGSAVSSFEPSSDSGTTSLSTAWSNTTSLSSHQSCRDQKFMEPQNTQTTTISSLVQQTNLEEKPCHNKQSERPKEIPVGRRPQEVSFGVPTMKKPQSQDNDTAATAKSDGEALLESILYNKPMPPSLQPFGQEPKKAPETSSSIQFNLDSPTRSNDLQQPNLLLQPLRTTKTTTTTTTTRQQQQPVLPAPVLEHRLMEILQRPIVLPSSPRHPQANTSLPLPNMGTTLSPLAASFTPSYSSQGRAAQARHSASPRTAVSGNKSTN